MNEASRHRLGVALAGAAAATMFLFPAIRKRAGAACVVLGFKERGIDPIVPSPS